MISGRNIFVHCASILTVAVASAVGRNADAAQPVNFTRDVRPILANNCFHCHGPDAADREADLRLDIWDSAGDVQGAEKVIDRKTPAESELIKRITSADPDVHMPPT